jgi:hypothetical protein
VPSAQQADQSKGDRCPENDGEFLGILFKVRNAQELWENDPKTYYWRCGDGVKYWSVRDAVVALSKITAVEEVPGVSRELIAA